MSTSLSSLRTGNRHDWPTLMLGAALLVATGVVLGMQYVAPDKRMLAVLVGLLVFGVAWRLDTVSAIGLLVLTLPYPRGTVFGSTNFAFILLLILVWLLRAAHGQGTRMRATGLDVPIVGLVIAYILSFYNVTENFDHAFGNFVLFIACLGMFYLIVNNIDRPEDLERLHLFQVASVTTVALASLYELSHPGAVLVPGWIQFIGRDSDEMNLHQARIGGPFFDYENMAEYCALNALFAVFLCIRSKSMARRAFFAVLAFVLVFEIFATVTRGALVALAIGLVYLLWIARRRVQFVPLTIVVGLLAMFVPVLNFYVANFTKAGDLFGRIVGTTFVGFVPDSRVGLAEKAFERWMMHPILGHGPYYETQMGVTFWYWPHCLYLYVPNLVGIVGLVFFLILLWSLLKRSLPPTDDVRHPNYAAAYLMVAHVMFITFLIDQIKIEYLRNPVYQFQIWLMFASIAAAHRIVARSPDFVRSRATGRLIPAPARVSEAPR